MLKRKETVIYLTIVFTFLIGVFIFVPAVAIQKRMLVQVIHLLKPLEVRQGEYFLMTVIRISGG